jgi:hypothetical protein
MRALFDDPRPFVRVTSPLEGEVGGVAAGRGVSGKHRSCGLLPSLTLPLKGGGNWSSFGEA